MVATASRSAMVSRTSSSSSLDHNSNAFNAAEQRRTRKRITAAQLVQLEELYYRSSHPTRDQREALAKHIQMYAPPSFSSLFFSRLACTRAESLGRETWLELYICFPLIDTNTCCREMKSVTIWFQVSCMLSFMKRSSDPFISE